MRFTLYDYTAYHNPEQANELLKKYGYAPERKIQAIANKLMEITSRFKEKALDDIKKIHPDKMLLAPTEQTKNTVQYANACGCASCQSNAKLNADAATAGVTQAAPKNDNTKDIILILIATSLIIYAIKA